MKKILWFLVVALLLFMNGYADAATYTIPNSDLYSPHFIDQGFSATTSETGRSNTAYAGWVTYTLYSTGYESKAGIGDSFDYDDSGYYDNAGFGISSMPIDGGGLGDLSGYDSYALRFHNPNTRPIHVNLFMNTGWTDPPVNEPNKFYENGWTWLNPGATATLTLDFTTEGVINDNHVSNIGFQAALPGPSPDYNWASGTGEFSVNVAVVPEPISSILFVIGGTILTGLHYWKRRKT